MQTRTYDRDFSLTFNSVMSVFQDLGFYSQKIADKRCRLNQGIWNLQKVQVFMREVFTGYSATSQTVATATIEEIGKKVGCKT